MSDRLYPKRPICGVGAFVIGSNGLLMARRDKEPGKGLWSVPGGAVELGETQEDAAKREILEETGIHIEILRLLGTADLIERDSDGNIMFHYVLNHYIARPLDTETHSETPDGEVAWFPLDRLPQDEIPELLWKAIQKYMPDLEALTSGMER
ncbi:MAG: NUDIX hydrolase [Candidatus Thorarchaeota archaeon]